MINIVENPTSFVLSSAEFDCGTTTAPPNVQSYMRQFISEALRYGLDIEGLCKRTKTASRHEAQPLLTELHDAASILYLQWTRLRQQREWLAVLAVARLFNGLTQDARFLQKRYQLLDMPHIEVFQQQLEQLSLDGSFNPQSIAAPMREAALAHTHEQAWISVILPTFARQPYGRILLFKVDIEGAEHPIFVTQPTFLTGQCTLFHTHGQNWAYSSPLGADGHNAHLNTLWMPRQPDDPYPLNLEDIAEYCSGEVAIVPPRLIHGISRKRCRSLLIPTLAEMLSDHERCQAWIDQTRFGEQSCLHVYCPDPQLSTLLADSPFVQEDSQFFIEYDMIVFDHYAETIWTGGGGSWPRRMIEFGTTGEHCGLCFEDDPRKENLDPQQVYDWFLVSPAPELIKFDGQ